MKRLVLISIIWTTGQCYGGTFSMDTIDNWQVYNGTDLILAGHDFSIGTGFKGTIKTADITDLVVQFNHCVRYIDDYEVTIEITNENGKTILTKTFRVNQESKMTIKRKELGQLTTKWITIRYREKRENGTDKILGQIRLE